MLHLKNGFKVIVHRHTFHDVNAIGVFCEMNQISDEDDSLFRENPIVAQCLLVDSPRDWSVQIGEWLVKKINVAVLQICSKKCLSWNDQIIFLKNYTANPLLSIR